MFIFLWKIKKNKNIPPDLEAICSCQRLIWFWCFVMAFKLNSIHFCGRKCSSVIFFSSMQNYFRLFRWLANLINEMTMKIAVYFYVKNILCAWITLRKKKYIYFFFHIDNRHKLLNFVDNCFSYDLKRYAQSSIILIMRTENFPLSFYVIPIEWVDLEVLNKSSLNLNIRKLSWNVAIFD